MNLQEPDSLFQSEPPLRPYRWPEIVAIVYVGVVMGLCTLFGLGIIASEAVPGNWTAFKGHTLPYRIISGVLGIVVVLVPVLGFILRGARGWIACLGCCYFLLLVSWVMVLNGAYILVACASVVVSAVIAAMQQASLRRFFNYPLPGLRQHLAAAAGAVFFVTLFGLSFILRSR